MGVGEVCGGEVGVELELGGRQARAHLDQPLHARPLALQPEAEGTRE
ncbi:hypothetical protein [Kitasatospora purpeofusca]|uniref:Uncharacterized protein n=1 Tax=Kitasatospora purpeofusca TaxID=67352 RepID=A0ABZ1UDM4_9ACTN|nr:hypothetical protein [Kitasatospora purpeofusca]